MIGGRAAAQLHALGQPPGNARQQPVEPREEFVAGIVRRFGNRNPIPGKGSPVAEHQSARVTAPQVCRGVLRPYVGRSDQSSSEKREEWLPGSPRGNGRGVTEQPRPLFGDGMVSLGPRPFGNNQPCGGDRIQRAADGHGSVAGGFRNLSRAGRRRRGGEEEHYHVRSRVDPESQAETEQARRPALSGESGGPPGALATRSRGVHFPVPLPVATA
jgi:hypothetical protein